MTNPLIGTWKLLEENRGNLPTEDDMEFTFQEDNTLTYEIYLEGKLNKIQVHYSIDGNTIITEKKYPWQHETTEFYIENDTLILKYENHQAKYIKIN